MSATSTIRDMSDDRAGGQHNDGDDAEDGKVLPTYEALAAKEGGPNSRFGRWQAWVEKRAAERYADEPQRQRQTTGWGPTIEAPEVVQPPAYSRPSEVLPVPAPAPPPVTRAVARCLSIAHFGSRFIPHSNTPISTLLPLGLDDRFLLLGTQHGLAVLDVLPTLHGAQPVSNPARILEEAKPRDIWTGEGVWQLELLETHGLGGPNPQGTVLAVVGADANEAVADRKGAEPMRTIRMYNLASLTSLVKWSVTRKDALPIDLRRPANTNPTQPPTTPKKHRPTSSVFSNFKAMFTDSQPQHLIQPYDPSAAASPTVSSVRTPSLAAPRPQSREASPLRPLPSPSRAPTADTPGDWDIIDDLPLRWATDYVSLSRPGSKLAGLSVLFFELWRDTSGGPGAERTYLAVATRQCIFLYESVPGERAFRVVKEFYTPLPARSIRFVQQLSSSSDEGFTTVSRSFSSLSTRTTHSTHSRIHSHSRHASQAVPQRTRRTSLTEPPRAQPQLALFVTFAKKAGLIRLGDAAVGEVELWDDELGPGASMSLGGGRRSVDSLTNSGFGVEKERGAWAPLEMCNIPVQEESGLNRGPSALSSGYRSPQHSNSTPTPTSAYPSTTAWSATTSTYPLLNSNNQLYPHPSIDTNTGAYSPISLSSPIPATAPPISAPSPPTPISMLNGASVYPTQVALLTRGRRTDVIALPLRTPVGARAPLCSVQWLTAPSKVAPRVCYPGPSSGESTGESQGAYLQIVAFLKEGVDVAEIPLSMLRLDKPSSKGKGKATGAGGSGEVSLVKVDVGGPAGYLASGGRWHRFGSKDSPDGERGERRGVQRADSAWSVSSWDSTVQEHQREKEKQRKAEEGCYAWVCRGRGDYYVVWIGGGMEDDPAHANGLHLEE
ncbi:hypothetical protein BDV93DRAFT_521639 [Ceratobasidium sp. AG-I]|nr:hypothetical protein BDV93DRAFT_521639 [Ceratobasidium sp. AG-I]